MRTTSRAKARRVVLGIAAALSLGSFCLRVDAAPRQVVGMETPALRKAADNGEEAAQLELARRLLFGRRAPLDPAAAVEILNKLSETKSPAGAAALYELSVCYRLGLGAKVDDKKGEELLKRAAEAKHPAAIVELWERSLAGQPTTQPTTGPATGPLVDVVKLARDGDASAQLALARAVNRKQISQAHAGDDALTLILKATAGEDVRVALAATKLIAEGDPPLRGDRPRAVTLYRRLAENGPREAQERLAALSPESFVGLAKPITAEKLSKDDGKSIGDAVRVSGAIASADTNGGVKMTLQLGLGVEDVATVMATVPTAREAAANAKPGRVARVAGVVTGPGEITGLVVEVPEPKYNFQFRVQPPQVIRGRTRKYIVEGVFHNTGAQRIVKATLKLRIWQPETPNDESSTLTLENVAPGERRSFAKDFNLEDFRDRGGTADPRGDVKVDEIEW